jgi:transcriptional regulator with XRE-family HTH domain
VPGNGEQGRDGYRSFGAYLRSQRQLAQLTLRQLADLSSISNPYLSQIERGLHQPSVAVIRSIADALNLSADVLLAQVAGLDDTEVPDASITTESAIRADPRLSGAQKSALLSVYRSMVGHPIGADDNAGPDSDHNTADNSAPTTGASNRDAGDHAPPHRSRSTRSPRSGTRPPRRDPDHPDKP